MKWCFWVCLFGLRSSWGICSGITAYGKKEHTMEQRIESWLSEVRRLFFMYMAVGLCFFLAASVVYGYLYWSSGILEVNITSAAAAIIFGLPLAALAWTRFPVRKTAHIYIAVSAPDSHFQIAGFAQTLATAANASRGHLVVVFDSLDEPQLSINGPDPKAASATSLMRLIASPALY